MQGAPSQSKMIIEEQATSDNTQMMMMSRTQQLEETKGGDISNTDFLAGLGISAMSQSKASGRNSA